LPHRRGGTRTQTRVLSHWLYQGAGRLNSLFVYHVDKWLQQTVQALLRCEYIDALFLLSMLPPQRRKLRTRREESRPVEWTCPTPKRPLVCALCFRVCVVLCPVFCECVCGFCAVAVLLGCWSNRCKLHGAHAATDVQGPPSETCVKPLKSQVASKSKQSLHTSVQQQNHWLRSIVYSLACEQICWLDQAPILLAISSRSDHICFRRSQAAHTQTGGLQLRAIPMPQ
jgi:hypothetical protein